MKQRLLQQLSFAKPLRLALVLSTLLLTLPLEVKAQIPWIFIGHYDNTTQATLVGTMVTDANADNVLGDNTVSYANGVLTLNNANIQGTIYCKEDMTIDLKGNNYITANDSNAIKNSESTTSKNLTFKSTDGTGKLEMKGKGNPCTSGFNSPTYQDGLSTLLGAYNDVNAVIGKQLFSGGDGTSESTAYLISTPSDLKDLSRYVNLGFFDAATPIFKLNDNINCNSLTGFAPIGDSTHPFKGTFNGGGKTISNLTCTAGGYLGLFGQIGTDGATSVAGSVSNIILDNCSFSGGDVGGAIAGYLSKGTINNCQVINCSVTTTSGLAPTSAGIAGKSFGTITNCTVSGCTITASTTTYNVSITSGGIAGTNGGTISGCEVIGSTAHPTLIKTIYDNGASDADRQAGGIVGNSIDDPAYTITISGNSVKGVTTVNSEDSGEHAQAGAIIGHCPNNSNFTLDNNFYEYIVKTIIKNNGVTDERTGYDQRGNGDFIWNSQTNVNVYTDITANKGAVMYTKALTAIAPAYGGALDTWYSSSNTYTDNHEFAPGQTAYVKATPATGFEISSVTVTYTDNGTQTITPVLDATNSTATYNIYSFTMPDAADVTASITYASTSGIIVSGNAPAADGSITGTGITGTVTFNTANNTLTLNDATLNGPILSSLGDLTIDIQGTNFITVSDTTAVIRSTNAGKLTISKTGATPSLRLQNTFNDSYPIYHCPVIKDFASFELSEGLYLSNAKSDGDFGVPALYESFGNLSSNGGNSTMGLVNAEQSYSWQPRGIRDVTISTDVYYPIWVAHHRDNVGNGYNIVYTQITPTNKDDFLGDGVPKVSFIPASASNENINTLKLNEAAITDAIFSNLANLTIEFSGTNTLCDNGKTTGYIHGADPNAIITFKALADNSSISLDCANDHAVVEGFANVAFDKAVAEYTGRFSYDTTERKYKNNYGDLQTLFIKTPTPPTMSYNSQEKVSLEKSYPDGDIYYTITYADGKTTDVAKTKYTAEFAMDAPGTVETWVEANGATTSSVKGKHFGYQEAQFSLLEQEELTPVLIPAIETGDNIDYATAATRYAIDDANVATFDNNGKITALAIGTATLTTQLAYASNLPHTTTILNYDEKFTTQLTVSKVFNVTFAEGANYMIYYNSAHDNLTIPDGMTAAIVTGVASSGTTVETTALSYIPETTAVLLGKGTSTGSLTVTKYITKDPAPTGNKLKYVDNTPVATTGYEYILYKDEFVKATGSIPDGKCYLDLTGAAPAPAPARSLGIDNDGTTDIRELRMENEERDEWYDLQGRRIEQPTKAGLYIKNGKKVIVNTK